MLSSSSSSFYTCIEGLKSALPNKPKYEKYRSELNNITETSEGKYKLIAIVNTLSLSAFERLQKECATLPWPDEFKDIFEVQPLIDHFYNAPPKERSKDNFVWVFNLFIKQHKYERAFQLLSRAPRSVLYDLCLTSLSDHIGTNKLVVKDNLEGVIRGAHTLTQSDCNRSLIKIIFERLILMNERHEELALKLQSSDDRSKVLFLLSVYCFQLSSKTRNIAEKYQQLMPQETSQQITRKEKLGDYYSVTKEWIPNDENDLFGNLPQIDRFMISTDGEPY